MAKLSLLILIDCYLGSRKVARFAISAKVFNGFLFVLNVEKLSAC